MSADKIQVPVISFNLGKTTDGEWHVFTSEGGFLGSFPTEEAATEFTQKLVKHIETACIEAGIDLDISRSETTTLYNDREHPISFNEATSLLDRNRTNH